MEKSKFKQHNCISCNTNNNHTFLKPVIDLPATGKRIKQLREQKGLSVRNIQDLFGFEYPQAVYAWEQGKNIPTVDNLLVLAQLFNVQMEEIVQTRFVEIELSHEDLCNGCKKKSA